jgi:hypothetical protein
MFRPLFEFVHHLEPTNSHGPIDEPERIGDDIRPRNTWQDQDRKVVSLPGAEQLLLRQPDQDSMGIVGVATLSHQVDRGNRVVTLLLVRVVFETRHLAVRGGPREVFSNAELLERQKFDASRLTFRGIVFQMPISTYKISQVVGEMKGWRRGLGLATGRAAPRRTLV